MLPGKLILKYLPFASYHKIRTYYRNLKKYFYKPLSEKDLKDILTTKLNIKSGDVVFVHSSIDKLNALISPHSLFKLLQQTVGETGTLLFPAWHFNYRAVEYLEKNHIFDVKRSPSALGLLSEIARRHPNAIRSLHPTTSIVAIGSDAEFLTSTHHHSIYPCGELSPFYKMLRFNAKIIGIGVSTEFLSFVHCPEDILKQDFPYNTRGSKKYSALVKDINGNTSLVDTLAPHQDIKQRNIPLFIKNNIPKNIGSDFKIRGNQFFYIESQPFFDKVISLAKVGKTIYRG